MKVMNLHIHIHQKRFSLKQDELIYSSGSQSPLTVSILLQGSRGNPLFLPSFC